MSVRCLFRSGGAPLLALGMTMALAGFAGGQMTPPSARRHLYSETANPKADIATALKQARAEHKRVILDFGGDWCGDCQVLDIYFHQQPNLDLLEKNFVLVHVWIGHMDQHVDVAEKYGVPLKHGVPALAVLDASGKVLFAQSTGDFSNMRGMNVQSVTDFLGKWKPQRKVS